MEKGQHVEGVTALLIAGGKSRRMGRDKRFLEINGRSLFGRTLEVLQSVFTETIVVLAEPIAGLNTGSGRIVYDFVPHAGSLGGLYTGLSACTSPRVFVVACDMPFLDPAVIRRMLSEGNEADIVVAERQERLEPMHAIYGRRCLPHLKAMAESGRLKLQHIFQQDDLTVIKLPMSEFDGIGVGARSFQNINTPEDLMIAEAHRHDEP